jgi:hypothetical protein
MTEVKLCFHCVLKFFPSIHRRNRVKEGNIMTTQSANTKDSTQMDLWLPRAVGLGLAAVYIGANQFVPLADTWAIIMMVAIFMTSIIISFFWKGIAGIIVIRWLARTVGVTSGALIAMIVIGESISGQGPPTIAAILDIAPWAALFIGIVITFFWEGIGGAIVLLAGLVEQGSVILVAHGGLNPYILVFVFVGLASVYCWWRTHLLSLTQQPA